MLSNIPKNESKVAPKLHWLLISLVVQFIEDDVELCKELN